ncbi:MAG TPA: hypothetical protein VFT59_00515 [Candidatus Saccharimonadales bacterium]|nr:hypothetical protein [Candidatus Saccharimonadales bacterium]
MRIKNHQMRRAMYRTAEKSSDPVLGLAVLTIAEKWAEDMERRIDDGERLEAIAIEIHQHVTGGAEGLRLHTEFGDIMVNYLNDCWTEGKQLADWYYGR